MSHKSWSQRSECPDYLCWLMDIPFKADSLSDDHALNCQSPEFQSIKYLKYYNEPCIRIDVADSRKQNYNIFVF